MTRPSVVYRETASDDLLAIFDWVLEQSQNDQTAERFSARILAACERIADVPRGGRPRNDLLPGLRTLAFERKAVIAYLETSAGVEIVRILYRGRDVDAFFHVRRTDED